MRLSALCVAVTGAGVPLAGLSVGALFLLLGAATLFNFDGFGRWLWGSGLNWFRKDRVGYRGWCSFFGIAWLLFGRLFIGFSV
jgi:hypothetical protein